MEMCKIHQLLALLLLWMCCDFDNLLAMNVVINSTENADGHFIDLSPSENSSDNSETSVENVTQAPDGSAGDVEDIIQKPVHFMDIIVNSTWLEEDEAADEGQSKKAKGNFDNVTMNSSNEQNVVGTSKNDTNHSVGDILDAAPAPCDENVSWTSVKDKNITLNIIGLFSMTGNYPAGMSYLPAALLAAKHINERDDILPGYKLKINAHDTACNESLGLNAFFKELYNPDRVSIMTLGGTCSHVTEPTTNVGAIWGLIQISYSALSPHLSNKELFPNFFRVMTPEQNLTIGRIKLFNDTGWNRVHIIYQNFKLFSTLDEYMRDDLSREGIQIASTEMFTIDPTNSVRNLRKNDARIIIVSMYEEKARLVMCAAYNLEPVERGKKPWYNRVVWILPSFYNHNWMYTPDPYVNCTPSEILEVLGSYFTVGSQVYVKDDDYIAMTGTTPSEFFHTYLGKKLYDEVVDEMTDFEHLYANLSYTDYLSGQHRAPEAYDSVWAIGYALNITLTYLKEKDCNLGLENFTYGDYEFMSLVHKAMREVSFNALSGSLHFNKNGDRSPGVEIMQYTNDGKTGSFSLLGLCTLLHPDQWNCTLDNDRIVWANGYPPLDGIQTKTRPLEIDRRLRYCLWAVSCVGIILSLGLLIFNIRKQNHRIIKMSSPRLNNIILVGCMLAYSTVMMLGVEGEGASAFCVVHTFMVVLSFSLSFGALFAKTWRVYEIFTAGPKVLNTRMLRDSSLFIIVSILVVINCLILVGWVVASPQHPTLVNISTTPATDESDTQYINEFHRCDSEYRLHFTWALVAIQGIVILLGTFLAIQTRKVSFPELNDSKWIALCIYNVVVLSPIGVVVVMATEDKPEINYALESCMLLLVTTMTQCLIFFPKIIAYRKHNRNQTSLVDIKLKLRQVNNVFTLLRLDGDLSGRKGSDVIRPDLSSTCCEASQQTENFEVELPSACSCVLNKIKASSQTLKSQSTETSSLEDFCIAQSPMARIDSQKIDVESRKPFSNLGTFLPKAMYRKSRYSTKCDKQLHRSKSDSNLRTGAIFGISPDDDENDYEGAVNYGCEREKSDSNSSLHISGARLNADLKSQELYSKFVLDNIKVKADFKLSSKLGFKASWKEGRGGLNQTEQVFQLLNRLRETVIESGRQEANV